MKKLKSNKVPLNNLSREIPLEDYLYFNTKEDEREAKSSIGVEYKMNQREYLGYNQDSQYSN